MNDFMKADVFFFVTTIAVVVVTALICVFAFYAIRTAREAHRLFVRMHKHVSDFEGGVDSLKRGVSANVHFLVRTAHSVASTFMKPRKNKEAQYRSSDF